MRAVSLFTGVGGFELGFDRAGIHTVLQAEQDKTCLEVLARHWPETERVADVRAVDLPLASRIRRDHAARGRGGFERQQNASGIDVVVGGFPCQDYSVAGQRAGLAGDRGALWWECERILRELQPAWCVWENVYGLLSSSGGRDFATILHSLDELGYVGAWRVLDAQHFGVPQRRRRVVIVAERGAADSARASQILALGSCSSGHPAKGSQAREGVARALSSGSHRPGVNPPGRRQEDDDNLVVGTLSSGAHPPGFNGQDAYSNRLVASSLRASDGHHGHSSPRGDGADNLIPFDTTQMTSKANRSNPQPGDPMHPLSVRRLTPVECERLMGWPTDHTRWAADGREITDSQRYKMCGNGVVSTVAEWVGHRLVATHNELAQELAA